MRYLLIVASILCAFSSLANDMTEITANEILKSYHDRGYGKLPIAIVGYVRGLVDAYRALNSEFHNRNVPQLYCSPDSVADTVVNGTYYVTLMEIFVNKGKSQFPDIGKQPASVVLLTALRKEFPCP